MNIRWVVFDAVGTLIYPTPDVATAYHQAGARHGSRRSIDDVRSRFQTAFRTMNSSDGSSAELQTSEAIEVARWKRVVDFVFDDLPSTGDCFSELYQHFARPTAWRCFDDVTGAFSLLRARGVKLAIASNFDSRLHAVCGGLPPLNEITRRAVSSELGFQKPSRSFYTSLLKMLDATAREVLVVGDDWVNDVRGAEEAGIRGVLLDRASRDSAIASSTDDADSSRRESVIHSLPAVAELIS